MTPERQQTPAPTDRLFYPGWTVDPRTFLAPPTPVEGETPLDRLCRMETDHYRDIALQVNDGPLNTEPVSVNQVRHISLALSRAARGAGAER